MKKQIIIATLALGAIVLGTNNLQAQTPTATTTVNITLADILVKPSIIKLKIRF